MEYDSDTDSDSDSEIGAAFELWSFSSWCDPRS
jgi:hypothetical protein